jgi:hypothetical protein
MSEKLPFDLSQIKPGNPEHQACRLTMGPITSVVAIAETADERFVIAIVVYDKRSVQFADVRPFPSLVSAEHAITSFVENARRDLDKVADELSRMYGARLESVAEWGTAETILPGSLSWETGL